MTIQERFAASAILSAILVPHLGAQSAPTVAPSLSSPGTVPGPSGAPLAGQFTYALSASESFVSGYEGTSGTGSSTNFSGQAEFVSNSERHPFSLIYSGGYFFGNGSGVTSSVFQSLGVTQILQARHWRLSASDAITFLPSSPLYSVSGVPGSGDIGSTPVATGGVPTQSILTNYGEQVTNTVSGTVSRDITGRTFLSGTGAYSTQEFLQSGFNNHEVSASASLGRKIDPLTTLLGTYAFEKYTVLSSLSSSGQTDFTTNGVLVSYSRVFSRRLSGQISAGPEWVSSNMPSLLPSRVYFSTAVTVSYANRRTRASATYSRTPNAGSGVLLGALSDDINVGLVHTFSTRWSGGLTANYGRAAGLETVAGTNTETNNFYGGVQANRRLSEDFSFFASYSAATQTATGLVLAANAFNGTANIVSVGLTYSPRPVRTGRP